MKTTSPSCLKQWSITYHCVRWIVQVKERDDCEWKKAVQIALGLTWYIRSQVVPRAPVLALKRRGQVIRKLRSKGILIGTSRQGKCSAICAILRQYIQTFKGRKCSILFKLHKIESSLDNRPSEQNTGLLGKTCKQPKTLYRLFHEAAQSRIQMVKISQ